MVDLFIANGDGTRGLWLRNVNTDRDGTCQHQAPAGCYVATFIAPDWDLPVRRPSGRTLSFCLATGERVSDIDAKLQ